jgi:SpoVK/Ycf46/Vps4 family AAA+-type ATPase
MPNKETRVGILKIHSGYNHTLKEKDFETLGQLTDGFSGSDISIIVNEALMRPIKELNTVDSFVKIPSQKVDEYVKNAQIQKHKDSFTSDEGEEESKGEVKEFVWIPQIEGHPLLEKTYL